MKNNKIVFEFTDGEIRAFGFSHSSLPLLFSFGNNRKILLKYDSIPISTEVIEQGVVKNEQDLIKRLTEYRLLLPGKKPTAYLAIPLQQGFIRGYSLPWLAKQDRTSAIALLVDEETSIARSDLLYDFLVLSEERNKSLHILLGATRQSIVEGYVLMLEQAGFEVGGVNFGLSVLGQVLDLNPQEDSLYLQGESGFFQITLYRGEVPESVRLLIPSLCDSTNEKQIKDVEKEIRRFLLFCQTQHSDLNLKRMVWNGDATTEKLAQGLAETNHLSMSGQAKMKSVPDSWPKILEQDAGRSLVVAGYGQRILNNLPVLNLWSQPTQLKKAKQRYLKIAYLAGILFMIGTTLTFSLNQITKSLQQEILPLSHQGQLLEDRVRDQQTLTNAWHTALLRKEQVGKALNEVQSLSAPGLTIEQMVYKTGSLSLSGTAKDSNSVRELIINLRRIGWQTPALTSYKLNTLGKVEFSLSARRNSLIRSGESELMNQASIKES